MRVLGIETSCDDCSVAVLEGGVRLRAHLIAAQDVHRLYGGVVPELASRDHVQRVIPLVEDALRGAGLTAADLDGVAYTAGPGLVGALLVGASFARSFAFARGIPAVPVNHLEGHLLAPQLEDPAPEFPFLALLVSGGHTMLVEVAGVGRYRVLGETLDDAASEAFAKTAKLLGLPYPGGKALAELATAGVPGRHRFPRPMLKSDDLDFSFAGLKTHRPHVWRRQAPGDLAEPGAFRHPHHRRRDRADPRETGPAGVRRVEGGAPAGLRGAGRARAREPQGGDAPRGG